VREDGIGEKSERHESFFLWSVVRSIEITDKHLFIMVDRLAGYIIPRRAFANEGDCGRFIGAVQQRCRAGLQTGRQGH
jgi:hypothetical protein